MTYSDFLHFVRSKKIKNHSRFFDMVPLNLTVTMTLRLLQFQKKFKNTTTMDLQKVAQVYLKNTSARSKRKTVAK